MIKERQLKIIREDFQEYFKNGGFNVPSQYQNNYDLKQAWLDGYEESLPF